MFSLICVCINGWVNNREAGDLRRHRGHYHVTVMMCWLLRSWHTNGSNVIMTCITANYILWSCVSPTRLQRCHNERDGVSNGVLIACSAVCSGADQGKHHSSAHRPLWWESTGDRSNKENVFIWWRHHDTASTGAECLPMTRDIVKNGIAHTRDDGPIKKNTHTKLRRIFASLNRVSIGSDNGVSPIRCQAII